MTEPITDHALTDTPAGRPGPGRRRRHGRKEIRRMAEQSGERPVTPGIGAELIRLMLPDMDPELVQHMLALVRDDGIDRAQLDAILRLNPEILPPGHDNPHPPMH
jgi:hypothetical protein